MTTAAQHSVSAPRESRFRIACPHCGSYARARNSYQLTTTYREVRFECTADNCGYIWVAGLEALRTLCPSDTPNPDVHIPLAEAIRQAFAEPSTPSAT